MKKEILLTISILVSGRNETTKKCLDSLKDLRKHVSCELLLTDTGCPQDMREWLEDYADRILDFTWCDDFSAARNVGLKAARGKWFLYMDDDEWFDDTTDIVSFFDTGEYLQYHCAGYNVRNYQDLAGYKYSDFYVTRMTEIIKGIEFHYPVHESLNPLQAPQKTLKAFVHHYGYVYKSDDEVRAKHERNMSLLLKAHEGNIHCLKHNAQMTAEYNAIGDIENSLAISYKGIQDYTDSDSSNSLFINSLYVNIVKCYMKTEEYEKAYAEAKRFIQMPQISALAVATICRDAIYICYMTERYKQGDVFLEKYLMLKAAIEENSELLLVQQTLFLNESFTLDAYRDAMGYGLFHVAISRDRGRVEKVFSEENLDWWEIAISSWCRRVPFSDIESLRCNLESMFREEDLYWQFLLIRIYEWTLIKSIEEEMEFSFYQEKIKIYAQKVILHYKRLYLAYVFEEHPDLLPKEYRIACILQVAIEILQRKDYVNSLKELKKAVEIGSDMTVVIRKFSRLLAQKSQNSKRNKDNEKAEFDDLTRQVKGKAREMIDEGKFDEALAVLNQLQTMTPDDVEIRVMEKSIQMK